MHEKTWLRSDVGMFVQSKYKLFKQNVEKANGSDVVNDRPPRVEVCCKVVKWSWVPRIGKCTTYL